MKVTNIRGVIHMRTPDLNWLKDSRVFQVNRLQAYSDHIYTIGKDKQPSSFSLNGTWKFNVSKNYDSTFKFFYNTEFNNSNWDDIQVPGHIQLQGFDQPHYTDVTYPWDGKDYVKPGQVDMDRNKVFQYRKSFDLPQDFINDRLILSFEGVESNIYIWLNGKFIGYSEDSFTPSRFDITKYVQEKDNILCVRIFEKCTGTWLEDQDMWRFSGIFRDVMIYRQPSLHILDLKMDTNIDLDTKKSILTCTCKLTNSQAHTLQAKLYDPQGNIVWNGNMQDQFEIPVENTSLWSSEFPNLYQLELVLYDTQNEILETIHEQIGFRKFSLEYGIMKLNGKRIVFHGINRHEWDPKNGRCLSLEQMEQDIHILKSLNINAVRTSHYPNHSYWYKLCDQYGIYVIDEMNLETHGANEIIPQNKPEWTDCLLDRARSMYERDKNHPCILMWSLGNEAGSGSNFMILHDYFKEQDPSRLVHYEGITQDRTFENASDIESRMYASPESVKAYLEAHPIKPFMLCEYMHAMGNSLGGMEEYTNLEDEYEQYQGGFVWDYVDQAIEKEGNYYYGQDFDDYPNDANFCGDGILLANRQETGKSQELKQLYRYVDMEIHFDSVTIKNKNLFYDLSKDTFVFELKRNGLVIQSGIFNTSVEPGTTKTMPVQFKQINTPGYYTKTIYYKTPFGIQSFDQQVFEVKEDEPNTQAMLVVEGQNTIGVQFIDTEYLFDKRKGLVSILVNNEEILKEAPRPIFYRALTDNDRGAKQNFAPWLNASLFQYVTDFKMVRNSKCAQFMYTMQLESIEEPCKLVYTIYNNQNIQIQMHMDKNSKRTTLPLFGIEFALKEEFSNFAYFGKGEKDTYIDRNHALTDFYFEDVKTNYIPYLKPQEHGNHVECKWCGLSNPTIGFNVKAENMECQASKYSFMHLYTAKHTFELPQTHTTYLRIAKQQMGVGGINSWRAKVQPQYLIDQSKNLDFTCTLYINKK